MAASSSPTNFVGLSGVRIVVVGDVGTGKSSLIVAAATKSFPENVPSVLPPTRPPVDYYPDRVPLTIIDTSSRFNIVGQWAVTTSVDFSLAQLIQVIILLSTGGNNGGGYLASKYVVIGFHGGILLIHAIINCFSIRWRRIFLIRCICPYDSHSLCCY
ncbi:Amino-acid permease BAT1 [Platanthera guangdongensis]|uniref:Amino-acid permease BAT1 n=1 Tax=Platanthera guangdongensis TaxID=2320717 RepID=A0ABR2M0N7_9ASPA